MLPNSKQLSDRSFFESFQATPAASFKSVGVGGNDGSQQYSYLFSTFSISAFFFHLSFQAWNPAKANRPGRSLRSRNVRLKSKNSCTSWGYSWGKCGFALEFPVAKNRMPNLRSNQSEKIYSIEIHDLQFLHPFLAKKRF